MRTAVKITNEAKNSTFENCTINGSLEDSGKNSKFKKTTIGVGQSIKEHPIKSIIIGVIILLTGLWIEYHFFK